MENWLSRLFSWSHLLGRTSKGATMVEKSSKPTTRSATSKPRTTTPRKSVKSPRSTDLKKKTGKANLLRRQKRTKKD